jgi:phosphate acetyltransferase
MKFLTQLEAGCSKDPKRVVLPEGDDPRILEAACRVARLSLAIPILVGVEDRIRATADKMEMDISGADVIDPGAFEGMDAYIEAYLSLRSGKRINRQIAAKVLAKDLYFGTMMVRMGDADGIVAGASNLTASVIKAGKLLLGLEEGVGDPSSFFVMEVPGRRDLVFADCAVNPNPGPDLLAQIAIASAGSARKLLSVEPRVAMLSFSTKGSADHADARKVSQATQIASRTAPHLLIDGEMQADAAVVPQIAESKGAADVIGGRANVLVFPDLDSGNIAYKLVQHLAGAKAYGPFLQGFRKPINDLSRGCTADEVVGAILVTAVLAGEGP